MFSRVWLFYLKMKLKGIFKYIEIYEKDEIDCFYRDKKMCILRRICLDRWFFFILVVQYSFDFMEVNFF